MAKAKKETPKKKVNVFEELRKPMSSFQWKPDFETKKDGMIQCLAFIDARDVMNRLDEVMGPENWQDSYVVSGDTLVAGIGLLLPDAMTWIWKYDTGKPTSIHKEKGWFSDAFKRAAVKWGIGRDLYNEDVEMVLTRTTGKKTILVDHVGKEIEDLTKYINDRRAGNVPSIDIEEITKKDAEEITSIDTLARLAPFINALNKADSIEKVQAVEKKLRDKSKLTEAESAHVTKFVNSRLEQLK